ncbi:hypothetical protein PFI31113_04661 [Pandoraea fibrosis]|uniref:Uncharacterized protein n=1 Tax=Pandoraea fibrosis TaxID=1891094 RepID=A0A5E4YR00_9BURK|nr:hypothetical protein PFI31113_04661 [Pandoraea fibrosis]
MLVRTRRLQRHGREHLATDRARGQFTHRHAIDRGQHRTLVSCVATVGCQEVDDVLVRDLRAGVRSRLDRRRYRLNRRVFRGHVRVFRVGDDRFRLFTAGDATDRHFTAAYLGVAFGLHHFKVAHDFGKLDIGSDIHTNGRIGELTFVRDMDLAPDEATLHLLDTRLDLRPCLGEITLYAQLVRAQIQCARVFDEIDTTDVLRENHGAVLTDVHIACPQRIGVRSGQRARCDGHRRHIALVGRERQIAGPDFGQVRPAMMVQQVCFFSMTLRLASQTHLDVIRRFARRQHSPVKNIILIQCAERDARVAGDQVALAGQRPDRDLALDFLIDRRDTNVRDIERTTFQTNSRTVSRSTA